MAAIAEMTNAVLKGLVSDITESLTNCQVQLTPSLICVGCCDLHMSTNHPVSRNQLGVFCFNLRGTICNESGAVRSLDKSVGKTDASGVELSPMSKPRKSEE